MMSAEFGYGDSPYLHGNTGGYSDLPVPQLRVTPGDNASWDKHIDHPPNVVIPPPPERGHIPRPTLETLVGNVDIHDVIANRLVPAPYPGAATEKYFIEGMPEVVVRHTPRAPEPGKENEVAAAFQALPEHGIPSLPYIPVEHNGDIYVVTRKLHGLDITEAAESPEAATIGSKVDKQWGKIIKYMQRGRAEGIVCASDILDPTAHMYGKTAVDTDDEVRLVDLGIYAAHYGRHDYVRSAAYERELISAARSIVELEESYRQPMTLARLALTGAVELGREKLGSEKDIYRKAFLNIAQYIVDNGVILDADDDMEFVLRFADDNYQG
jgi:hypothetical protein